MSIYFLSFKLFRISGKTYRPLFGVSMVYFLNFIETLLKQKFLNKISLLPKITNLIRSVKKSKRKVRSARNQKNAKKSKRKRREKKKRKNTRPHHSHQKPGFKIRVLVLSLLKLTESIRLQLLLSYAKVILIEQFYSVEISLLSYVQSQQRK